MSIYRTFLLNFSNDIVKKSNKDKSKNKKTFKRNYKSVEELNIIKKR